MLSGADFSPCRKYRYSLWRRWAPEGSTLTYIMLNPSTADEARNDPTIARCVRRAKYLGHNAINVVNLFAFVSVHPHKLYREPHCIGERNDEAIVVAAKASAMTICAWGIHGMLHGRGAIVKHMLTREGIHPYALSLLKCAEPGHPLYLPYTQQPFSIAHDPR